MYKLSNPKGGVNFNKIHEEIGNLEIPYYLVHDENSIIFIFPNIRREEVEIIVDGEVVDTVITYKIGKETSLKELNEGGDEVYKSTVEWLDFDFQKIEDIIDQKIALHDPTPLPLAVGQDEFNLDIDFRLTLIELGV